MSLACYECEMGGSFDTLILFSKNGFRKKTPISHYANFYTDCAKVEDFTPVKKSLFAIAQERESDSAWFTGNDGPRIADTKKFALIDEKELAKKLPRIHAALAGRKL